ncbi:MAG TPA: CpXC domain-containing protein [Gemmataceae bacterium]|jgi:hypothetical protein|nr:CpXC domain-containing protein [Gemmataceae bacterium]
MSIFRPATLTCPACDTAVDFEAVHSVNVDARPDLRIDIVANTFQEKPCPKCGKPIRLDPEFNVVDTQRGQWIAAAPLASLIKWKETEAHAKEIFDRSFGPDTAAVTQEIGKAMHPRVTFGWPALREKLLAYDHELDDVTLELCKAFIMRSVDSPIAATSELRLLDVDGDRLHLGWLLTADGSLGPTMKVSRSLYDQIAADADGAWADLRDEVSSGYFVDINRLMMA